MGDAPSADQELLRQLAKGDEHAFLTLYGRYQGPLYRFALHMSGNAATAEEVTQEVFMLLMKKPKGYEPDKGSFAGYLFGIARNVARRSMQRSRLDQPIEDENFDHESHPALASDVDLVAELNNAELIESLRRAVLALPEPYREVVALCELEEMSYADAAAALDCSPGTVASRLHRARAMLKSKMTVKRSTRQKCAK